MWCMCNTHIGSQRITYRSGFSSAIHVVGPMELSHQAGQQAPFAMELSHQPPFSIGRPLLIFRRVKLSSVLEKELKHVKDKNGC